MSTHLLRTARCLRNLTIKQLADEARIGSSTVWRAEHSYPINAESRRRLCQYFGMTARELGLVEEEQTTLHVEQAGSGSATNPHTAGIQRTPMVLQKGFQQEHRSGTREPEIAQEQRAGAWLALNATELSTLFEAGWTIDEVLNSLRVILRGAQGMPPSVRQKIMQIKDIIPSSDKHISMEERVHLCDTLRQSVSEGWQRFHTMRPTEVLVSAQAQLYLVQQTHELIFPEVRYSLYAGLYNLIGAAAYLQGSYAAAQQAYTKAHIAALEGADIWNMAQNLNWQAIIANVRGQYESAIAHIEAALRLIASQEGEAYVRLRAHLFTDWAYNASFLQDAHQTEEKLDASAKFLEKLGPHEEFDATQWQQMAGSSMLNLKHYSRAVNHLETALEQQPEPWIIRRARTLMPLAEAYARKRELDASLVTARHIVPLLEEIDSSMLNQRFVEYQQVLVKAFPHEQRAHAFIQSARPRPMLTEN
ncbi:helix-turn-helix domain-containing protein [Dictyobacter kobayashii]|uniref:HTH cro/C1-type domain-containing protein n=1 Tax=Dictyobacter kobayashii TaxID=2014872 RepID=A0A402ARL4_9CHLR|nr:helix-turn-helix transcriptional regulator [Dictyobacter kobayashii]GCE21727.1 hypothetical protein KDK_55270 [Dictyobacter kobayashii]